MRIVFMGTPDFAAVSLQAIINSGINIVAVVTAPDKQAGRGLHLKDSAVKVLAQKYNLPIMQPSDLSDPSFEESLKKLKIDLQIVVAFKILPESIWSIPKYGTINLHASLLPDYRGAAPIHWALVNGESETGLTTFFINSGVDTGDLIMQEKVKILDSDNFDTLYAKMQIEGAKLLVKTINMVQSGSCPRISQQTKAKNNRAPKILKSDCQINWDQNSNNVRNFVRGLCSKPGAFSYFNGTYYKIFDVEIADGKINLQPGEVHVDNSNKIIYAGTKSGAVSILFLQKEGRKSMQTKEFLLGNTIYG